MNTDTKNLLENVKNGNISVDEALLKLKIKPFEDIDYAKVDMHRKIKANWGRTFFGSF